MTDSTLYRRNLPHAREANATYFVTWRIARTQPGLVGAERDIVVEALRHSEGRRYHLLAYVVMDDHVHAVVTPLDGARLQAILHTWKSFTAHRLQRERGRRGRVWQDESFDRIIRNEGELIEKLLYVAGNPRKRWPAVEGYPWLGGSLMG